MWRPKSNSTRVVKQKPKSSPLRYHSTGKCVMLPCTTTAFTYTGKPIDFAVLFQLVVPYRPSMRFLFIGSQLLTPFLRPCGQPSDLSNFPLARPFGHSPSLPSHGRSPFRSWLQMVVSFIFIFWFSYRGLAPHLHRAHAGHTQAAM